MIILRNTIIFLLLATLAAIAVVGIMIEAPPILGWTPHRINALGNSVLKVMRPGYGLLLMWWGVLALLALAGYLTFGRKKLKLEVQMDGGKVIILDTAIKKYIRNSLSDLHDVNVKKIELKSERGRIVSNLFADVRTRDSLPVLERKIIERVRRSLLEDLGITNLGEVNVLVKNFDVSGRSLHPSAGKTAAVPAAAAAAGAAASDSLREDSPENTPDEEILILPGVLETENVSADAHTIIVPEAVSPVEEEEPLVKYANYSRDEDDYQKELHDAKTERYSELMKSADAAHPPFASGETPEESGLIEPTGETAMEAPIEAGDGESPITENESVVLHPPNPFAYPSDEEALEDPAVGAEFADKTDNESGIPEINHFGESEIKDKESDKGAE